MRMSPSGNDTFAAVSCAGTHRAADFSFGPVIVSVSPMEFGWIPTKYSASQPLRFAVHHRWQCPPDLDENMYEEWTW